MLTKRKCQEKKQKKKKKENKTKDDQSLGNCFSLK